MCLVLKNCMLDIQLKDDNDIEKSKIQQFIWDVSSNIGALLIHIPLVVHFPLKYEEVECCIDSMERERVENNISAKRMKELLVGRKNTTSGFSGIGLYEGANCSLHIWPEKNYMSFDISNTIQFNNNDVLDIVYKHFNVDKISGLSISRYRKSPQIVEIIK